MVLVLDIVPYMPFIKPQKLGVPNKLTSCGSCMFYALNVKGFISSHLVNFTEMLMPYFLFGDICLVCSIIFF